jgi:tetratricopeptide (TPR) repeat protein
VRRSILFAIPAVLLIVPCGKTQEVPNKPAETAVPSPPPSNLTPRQIAEMRADILMARKEYEEAIEGYQKILKQEPKNAEILNKVGVAYQQLTDLKHSEHFYKKAMEADKTFASAVNNIGTVEYERGRYGKAVKYYLKAVEFGKDLPTVYSNLGYAYVADKHFPEAIDSFRKALALDPTIFETKGGSGTIIQDRSSPDPGLFYYFVAKTFALSGDAEHAAHYLKLARDDGYKDYKGAETDPAFAKVIKDPRVQEVLQTAPSYATENKKSMTN